MSTLRCVLAQWMLKKEDGEKNAKTTSFENKYLRFCLAEHTLAEPKLPVVDCFSLINLMMFAIWCSKNGINGGWQSVSNYTGATCKMMMRYGVLDVRTDTEQSLWWWEEFRSEFKRNVPTLRQLKLRIQPAHHQAMTRDMDVEGNMEDCRDAALYAFLMFFSVRVGHAAPKSSKDPKHVLLFEDVMFLPNIIAPTTVFVYLKSTKTRGVNEGRGTWQAASKLPASPGVDPVKMCPVITMRNYFLQVYDNNPKAPLFQTMKRPGSPLPRGAFTIQLRARLSLAARHLDSPINVHDYSGISWRKAGLSLLAGQVAVNFLADHGDHADIRSTREYTTQSIEERGNNAVLMARRYG